MEANNTKAMREALEEILEKIDKWRTDNVMEHWQYSQLFDIADHALAEPARNCDVGSPQEQRRRYDEWRNHDELRAAFGKDEFEWAQMPYEEGGAK